MKLMGAFNEAETVHKEALAGKGATDTKSVSEQLAAHKDAQRRLERPQEVRRQAVGPREAPPASCRVGQCKSALAKGLKKAFSACEAKVSECQSKVDEHAATSPGDADALQRQARNLSPKKRGRSQRAQRTEAQLKARLKFDYEHPGKVALMPRKCGGVLASLVQPCDRSSQGPQVVAGGRLYQVVVDDEKTGKALLERGQLRRRVTRFPLNKVRAGRLDEKMLVRARLRWRRRPAGVPASL